MTDIGADNVGPTVPLTGVRATLGRVRYVLRKRVRFVVAGTFLLTVLIFALKALDIGLEFNFLKDVGRAWSLITTKGIQSDWKGYFADLETRGWVKFALLIAESAGQGAALSIALTLAVNIRTIINQNAFIDSAEIANALSERLRKEAFWVHPDVEETNKALLSDGFKTALDEMRTQLDDAVRAANQARSEKEQAERAFNSARLRVSELETIVRAKNAELDAEKAKNALIDDLLKDMAAVIRKYRATG